MGVYTDNTATDSNDPTAYSWSLIKGAKGDTGDSAYSYELLCEPSAVTKGSSSEIPAAITFTSKRSQGTSNPENYSGRFIIATSTDGTT